MPWSDILAAAVDKVKSLFAMFKRMAQAVLEIWQQFKKWVDSLTYRVKTRKQRRYYRMAGFKESKPTKTVKQFNREFRRQPFATGRSTNRGK